MSEPRNIFNHRLKARESEAFHVIYKKYFQNLCNFAMRYVYDTDMAKDIVQDAYTTLWSNLDKYDPNKDVLPYLISIIKNSCKNYLKSLSVKDSHQDKVIEALIFSNMEEGELDEDLRRRLKEALALLPCQSYQAIIKHIVESKKVSQVAQEMDISESTVKTHLKRGMKIIRKNFIFILFG